ncbi:MAG: hypothetical protein ACHREM_03555 [Polyangiales bacterium]
MFDLFPRGASSHTSVVVVVSLALCACGGRTGGPLSFEGDAGVVDTGAIADAINHVDATPVRPDALVLDFGIPPTADSCAATTCARSGVDCGEIADGCGRLVDCGVCPTGMVCGANKANVCGTITIEAGPPACPPGLCCPVTCTDLNINCGLAGDGCGAVLDCGTCPVGLTCGGDGVPGLCGGKCLGLTCAELGINCGNADDHCGGVLSCGTCPAGATCGGLGVPNVCGAPGSSDGGIGEVSGGCGGLPGCCPMTCAEQGIACGIAGDGCGGELHCGDCPAGTTCGHTSFGRCG